MNAMLSGMDAEDIGRRVKAAREKRRWPVEEAARQARINRVTWNRIESGQKVQDVKLRAALDALGLSDDAEPGEDIAAHRKEHGLSRSDMAELLGAGPKAVADWENGGEIPPRVLERLRQILAAAPSTELLAEVARRVGETG